MSALDKFMKQFKAGRFGDNWQSVADEAAAELAALRERVAALEAERDALRKATGGLVEYLKDNDLIDCVCDNGDDSVGLYPLVCEYHIAVLVLAKESK